MGSLSFLPLRRESLAAVITSMSLGRYGSDEFLSLFLCLIPHGRTRLSHVGQSCGHPVWLISQRSIKFFARSLRDARVLPTLWTARNSHVAGRCLLQRQVRTSRRSDVYRVGAGYETDRLSDLSRNIRLRPAISLSIYAQVFASTASRHVPGHRGSRSLRRRSR